MTPDLDIYRTANTLLKQHGDLGAEMHAAMRADELLEAGDMDGRPSDWFPAYSYD